MLLIQHFPLRFLWFLQKILFLFFFFAIITTFTFLFIIYSIWHPTVGVAWCFYPTFTILILYHKYFNLSRLFSKLFKFVFCMLCSCFSFVYIIIITYFFVFVNSFLKNLFKFCQCAFLFPSLTVIILYYTFKNKSILF